MPNWCCGNMTLSGKVSDLYHFVTNGLIHEKKKELKRSNGHFKFAMPLKKIVWIVDQLGFCLFCEKALAVTAKTDDAIVDLKLDYSKAQNIDAEELLALSNKFALDVKVYASDYRNCIRRLVEIQNGEIIQDESIEWY